MRFTTAAIHATVLLTHQVSVRATANANNVFKVESPNALDRDEKAYWERQFLRRELQLGSMPTSAPTMMTAGPMPAAPTGQASLLPSVGPSKLVAPSNPPVPTPSPFVQPPSDAPVTQRPTPSPTVQPPPSDAPVTQPPTPSPTVQPPSDAPVTQPPTPSPTVQPPPSNAPVTQPPTPSPTVQPPPSDAPVTQPPTPSPFVQPPPSDAPFTQPPTFLPTELTESPSNVQSSSPSSVQSSSPSNALSSSPSNIITLPPTEPEVCSVDINVGCSAADGQDCRQIEGEMIPQCFGAQPTQLCFRYTANPCGDIESTSGLQQCRDFNSGPQAMANIVVTDGPTVLLTRTVDIGNDFCVENDGEVLPSNLFINVNQLGNLESPTASQIVAMDATCDGVGLKLLESFGAVDFIGYSNGNGDQQCFVDVEYSYVAQNVGGVDLTVAAMNRTLNGMERNLLSDGVDPMDLELSPLGTLTVTENVTIERCVDMPYITTAFIISETAQGSTCSDFDDFAFDISVGTTIPTESPSGEPTAPSSSPSDVPNPVPSTSPSLVPPPVVAPTDRLTFQPTAAPTTIAPSQVESDNPTLLPSSIPSDGPSSIPSSAPSAMPSSAPSIDESTAPSVVPESRKCFLSLTTECTPLDGSSESCESIPSFNTQCEGTPFAMIFLYTGSGCDDKNNAPASLVSCEDFQGGPPTEVGEASYIVVTDIEGRGIVYHEDFVAVGGDFLVADGANDVQMDLNVTIYSSSIISFENMLQTVILDSSCFRNLGLKDEFGAVQLITFVNEEQGQVSSFIDAFLSFAVENTGDNTTAALETLFSTGTFGDFDLSNDADNVNVQPGSSRTFIQRVVLDLTIRRRYSVTSNVTGLSSFDNPCEARDSISFVTGNPLPPLNPTEVPTAAPTTTALPTIDPEGVPCELKAQIRCSVVAGSFPNNGCGGIQAPTETTCLGDDAPSSLSFIYTGFSCPGNNDASGFRCEDIGGGVGDQEEVWVEISGEEDVMFSGVAKLGEQIAAVGAFSSDTFIVISEVESDGPGTLLQSMRLSTRCIAADDLTLLNSFGSLQLVGFSNGPSGSQAAFATILIEYLAINDGGLKATADVATSEGAFAGMQDLIFQPTDAISRKDQPYVLGSEEALVNLAEATGQTFSFSLMIDGSTLAGGGACADPDDFAFSII